MKLVAGHVMKDAFFHLVRFRPVSQMIDQIDTTDKNAAFSDFYLEKKC